MQTALKRLWNESHCESSKPWIARGLFETLATVMLIVLPSAAHSGLRYGVSFSGSLQDYGMQSVRSYVTDWADQHSPGDPFQRGRASGDRDSNPGFGGGLRLGLSDRLMASVEYTRLTGWVKILKSSMFNPPSFSEYGTDVDVSANVYSVTVSYLPGTWGPFRVGAGLGGGYYIATGDRTSFAHDVERATYEWKGSGFGTHAMGILETHWRPNWGMQIGMGYRSAKTSTLEENGAPVRTSSGEEVSIDWGGPLVALGVYVDFGK